MQDLGYILSLTGPIFILIAIGYLVVNSGWMAKENVPSLAWFVINVALPAALFKALSSRSFQDILHYDYLLVYGLGSLFTFFALFFFARFRQKKITECALFGLGASISSSLLIGFPIVWQLFADQALVPFTLTLIVENLLILPLALALADTGQQKNSHLFHAFVKSIFSLFKNPIILAIIFGMAAAALNYQPPALINNVIEALALTVGGLSLFVIGGMLVGLKATGILADLSTIVVGKLIIHPLIIIVLLTFFPSMSLVYQHVAILLACVPMFSIFSVIGMRYRYGGLCSAVLLPTTLLSFITINLVVWFILS